MYAKFEKWIVLSFRVINRGSDSDSSVRKYADESRRKWKCVYECARVAFAESTNERKDRWCSLVQRNCIETTRVIKYSRIRAVVVRGRGGADERRKHESSTRVWSLCTGGCHTIRRLEPSSCIVRLDTNDYNSRQLKRLVCGIYFQCSAREHWMAIKKSFFFFLFSFYAVRIGREPSAHVTVYSSRSLRIYIYIHIHTRNIRNCLADFYIPMMYEIYANICHEHGSTRFLFFFFTRAFLSFNGSQLYEENGDLTLRFRQTPIEIRPESQSGKYQLGPKLCQAESKNPYVGSLVLVSFPFSFLQLIIFLTFQIFLTLPALLQKRVSFFRVIETIRNNFIKLYISIHIVFNSFLSFNFHDIINWIIKPDKRDASYSSCISSHCSKN